MFFGEEKWASRPPASGRLPVVISGGYAWKPGLGDSIFDVLGGIKKVNRCPLSPLIGSRLLLVQLLYQEWARYGVFYKFQPIDLIR